MRKPGKQELYYNGLQDTIYPMVNIYLNNIDDIMQKTEDYVRNQSFMKRLNRSHMSNELLIYIIGERFIDVVLEQLRSMENKPNSYQEFEDHIFQRVHSIGLYNIVISTPESIPAKLIMTKSDYMKREFVKL